MSYAELDLAIIKEILTNKKHALEFANNCSINLFSSDLWNFTNLLMGYIKAYKDIPTLSVLQEKAVKINPAFIDVVSNIWKQADSIKVDERDYVNNIEKLKNRFSNEEIKRLKDRLLHSDSDSDIDKNVIDIERTIKNIRSLASKEQTFDKKTLKDYVPIFIDKYNDKKNNQDREDKIKTGYSFFDYATNGVGSADFVVIAGESGFGKSLLLNNIGVQVWLQKNTIDARSNFTAGKNVAYFSLEMPYEDCFNRLLSRLSGVPSRKIENAKLNKEEFNKVKQALDFIQTYPYQFEIVDIPNACANDLEAVLNDMAYEVDIIFVDYLGIMKTNDDSSDQDWLKQGEIAYQVRAIGRKYNLPIFTAVQLNRKSTGKDSADTVGLSRLARSATIATHATTVIQIENRQNEENYSDFIYHIIKNRKGPKGKGKLLKNLPAATLLDIAIDVGNEYNTINIGDISGDIEDLDL